MQHQPLRSSPLLAWAVLLTALADVGRAGEPPGKTTAASGDRPANIVLIMADDMGFADLGCYGSEIQTPHLDRLAAGGLRFTQFYNGARCCPTRASLLTGLYPHQAGMPHMVDSVRASAHDLSDRAVTIAEALRPAGYRTLMAGKWHVTPLSGSKHNWPVQRGFDRFYGTIAGAGSYFDPVTLTRDNDPIAPERDGYFYTDALGAAAVRFLDEAGRGPAPFFLYVAFTAPHWPLHAPAGDAATYEETYRAGWEAVRAERHRRMIELGIVDARWPLAPRDPAARPWEDVIHPQWQARRMAVYAAQVERMDRGVGAIVAKLRELGTLDQTLILFLSDNGGCAEEIRASTEPIYVPERAPDGRPVRPGNDPAIEPGGADTYASYGLPWAGVSNTPFRRYKHWVHEGGIATPLIAHWPAGMKAEPGSITHQPGHLIDLMATCLDVAGAAYPETYQGRRITPLEGKSLRPILEGKHRAGHEALFWEHEGHRAVRQGRWKLVAVHGGAWELYDMEADRTELHNLAGARPELVAELAARYDRWAARCGVRPWDEVDGSR